MPIELDIKVKEIEYRSIDSTQLQIKVLVSVDVTVKEERSVEGITEINIEVITENKRPSVIVYYVKPNDTLWDIAKKYRSTVDDLKEYNDLKDNIIYPNQQLIIPKRNPKLSI